MELLLATVVFAAAMAGMGLGVMVSGRRLRGSLRRTAGHRWG